VNLWATLLSTGQLKQSSVVVDAAAETASRFGLVLQQRWIRGCRALDTFDRGNWNDAQVLADELLADVEAGSPHYSAPTLYAIRALIRIARDDVAGALADTEQATNLARLVKDPQILYATLAIAAHVSQETRNLERAAVLADELLSALRTGGESGGATDAFHMLAWTLSALGRRQELIDVLPTYDVPWVHAARAFAEGELRRAADICGAMGGLTEEARDRLWLAEALIKQGRRSEADVELQRALAFYRSVDATRYIREAEALLAASA
jgi:tetratricopeptide (TPR) repeat protein